MRFLDKLKLPELSSQIVLDDTGMTLLHADILQRKQFLRRLYLDFYRILRDAISPAEGDTIVELGSGAGFIKEVIPAAVTSDILPLPTVDKVFSALEMPFEPHSVDAIVMIDVLHHIPDVRRFFREAVRCLKPAGRIAMIEPANTLWSRFIYTRFHHETFDPKGGWTFASERPLATANGALPWILFHRDKNIFAKEFPDLSVHFCMCHTPLRYLLSGGFSLRQLVPDWSYPVIKGIETLLGPFNPAIGLFETVVLVKLT